MTKAGEINGAQVTRALAVLGAALATLTGCGSRAPDINQVQPGYVRKSIFLQDSPWYYKRTIVKSETTNGYAIEGMGDWALEQIRWNVQEKLLIAYKPYEAVPGEETATYPGSTDFQGVTLAAFPITEHFDIKRGYDPQTGNETNVVSENTTDRQWFERDYFRVNWAANQVDRSIYGDFSGEWFPISYISTGTYWMDQDSAPTDQFASRFTDDYIEVTQSALLGMDIITCASFTGFSVAGFPNCGYGEAKVRHSFVRVKEPSYYAPVEYPDSVVRTDAAGNPMADPSTGEVLREPIFNRFGFFRSEFPTYDRGYGTTQSGQVFRAFTINIWQKSVDDSGKVIPFAMRTPKPIIYYLNAEFPDRWKAATASVALEYDRVFKGMVSDLVTPANTPAHMFEIRENDCNPTHVRDFIKAHPQYLDAVARGVCPNSLPGATRTPGAGPSGACPDPLNSIAPGNLTTVCTSLEAATRDPSTNVPLFDWQRMGDGRWFMINWLNNPQNSGWSGLGLVNPDGQTGEAISGAVYIQGQYLEVAASNVTDYIALINDERSLDQIIFGQDIRKQVQAEVQRATKMSLELPSPAFLGMMNQRLARYGTSRDQLLDLGDPLEQANRLQRSVNSPIEEALISDYDVAMASGGTWKRGDPITDDLRHAASPYARIVEGSSFAAMREKARLGLGASGLCFPSYDFDIHWAGLALQLKDTPPDQRYQIVANRLITSVILHEVGHNVGLRHNFEGSFDALNYPDQFWQLNLSSPSDVRIEELRNTTVMEYMGSKGLFTDRLGKYDEAAIRFAYANQVATFTSTAVDPGVAGGVALQLWRYRNDYRKIPGHLCGGAGCASSAAALDAITRRQWVTFNPQNPPRNEVPFHFCSDEYNRMTPFCSTFDYGSNLREIFANYHTIWSNYFFFNNFVRDRLAPLAWEPNYATIPLQTALDFAITAGQYYYYMNAVDPAFAATDLASDMLATTAAGLNMAAEVMATPEPIRMCPLPQQTNPKVYVPWFALNGCDQYAPIDGAYAQQLGEIQPAIGDARPATIGFTEDYEDWDWSFIGSYFDKSNVLWLLGYDRPHFFRFNFDVDLRNYHISLFRLFEPELRSFYDRVINFDGYFVEQQLAQDVGSYWCEDVKAPGVASLGRLEPRRLLDVTSTGTPSLPGPSRSCANPSLIYPTLLRNIPFDAMYYAHTLFSSDFDAQLDMGKSLKIYVVGAEDDYPSWDQLTPSEYCTVTDSQTGIQYRALHQSQGKPDLACRLVAKAAQTQMDYEGSNGLPDYKDRWRAWMERLEWARDLSKLYDVSSVDIPPVQSK